MELDVDGQPHYGISFLYRWQKIKGDYNKEVTAPDPDLQKAVMERLSSRFSMSLLADDLWRTLTVCEQDDGQVGICILRPGENFNRKLGNIAALIDLIVPDKKQRDEQVQFLFESKTQKLKKPGHHVKMMDKSGIETTTLGNVHESILMLAPGSRAIFRTEGNKRVRLVVKEPEDATRIVIY